MLKYYVIPDGLRVRVSVHVSKKDAIKIRSFLITLISRSRRRCVFYKGNDFSLQTCQKIYIFCYISYFKIKSEAGDFFFKTFCNFAFIFLGLVCMQAQHITRKTKPILSSYKLNNTALELYAAEKDLGVWITRDLTWHKQVNEQSSCANKLLGYLKRNTRFILRTEERRTLYLSLVRPHLGYATQIWAPQSIELIVKFERIQRRATKFILKLPYSSNISYKSRLQTLNLIPICYWHELLDLTFFFKLTHGLVNVNSSVLPEVRKYGRRTRSSTSNVNKYIIKKCKTTTYQKSFLIRTCRIWNCFSG